MNEVSKENPDFKNVNGYNKEYCQKAAEAFGEALKINKETGLYQLSSYENYMNIFYTYDQGKRFLVRKRLSSTRIQVIPTGTGIR